ncbi:MAG TPA: alpha/beta hydrolase, partial [Burkholderiales bacterium]|nr:alpha/beta hydrolase [Burkholderiales bacterium]
MPTANPAHGARPTRNDLLYNPRLSVSGMAEIFARWSRESERARAGLAGYFDVPYGPGPAERLDIFRAYPQAGPGLGTVMFIHGGYWRAFGKRDFSFVAPALARAGVTVAVVDYALCPAVTVPDIVMQMVQATAWLHRNAGHFGAPSGPGPSRLCLVGHSAGGQLAAMLQACLWPVYAPDLPAGLGRRAVALSGLYDLAPLLDAPSLNADIGLDAASARKASPMWLPAGRDARLVSVVGDRELQGFHDQDRLIRGRWKGHVAAPVAAPGADHFTVLDTLLDPGSGVFRA